MSRAGALLSIVVFALACGETADDGPGGPSRVFVSDFGHGLVASFAGTPAGATLQPRIIDGADIVAPQDVAYDAARDELYVGLDGLGGYGRVLVYQGACTAAGTATPDRSISLGTDRHVRALWLEPASDVLYVAVENTYSDGEVLVFQGASTLEGATAAARTITLIGTGVDDLAVDTGRNLAYVLSNHWSGVFVIDGLDTAAGSISPRRIYSASTQYGVALDPARDRLYVSNWGYTQPERDGVVVLSNASAITTPLTSQDGTLLPVPGARRVDLDTHRDTLYVLSGRVVTTIAGASTATASSTKQSWQSPEGTSATGAAFAP